MTELISNDTVTKNELSEALFDRVGLNKREAKDMIDAFFDRIGQSLKSGFEVKISGFGTFQLRNKSARPGRNLKTGQMIPIAARRVVTFHASQKLKDVVESYARENRV
ncbi:integration host factor subunit alpha [Polynucleobacter necessarius]|uniref:integration host factor subunit alpha n=1 Tax=Polynucleobacter necessarius TaxID=576610 RepID=UPI000E093186|nr:integration host factor subunit alpha [Polynucleobacter necessarius]HAT39200.1 integration host factor subunit alpha [Polynucleobacter sp.]